MRITRTGMTALEIMSNVTSYLLFDSHVGKEVREHVGYRVYLIDVTLAPRKLPECYDPEFYRALRITGTMGHTCASLLTAQEFKVNARYVARRFSSIKHEGNWRPHYFMLESIDPCIRCRGSEFPFRFVEEELENYASPQAYTKYLLEQDEVRVCQMA